ncbi:MAG TPA: trypsin-like peptidase domain-containing protein [Thermoanaerobaculia bacterium]|jgi:hypothetical protein
MHVRDLAALLVMTVALPARAADVPELLRLTARPATLALTANLQQEATVETLARPVTLLPEGQTGKLTMEGAATLRLHVATTTPGTVLWIAGEGDETFERFEPGASATWGPTTYGPTVYVAAEGDGAVEVTRLAIGVVDTGGPASACLKDLACASTVDLPEVAEASRAIAMLRFVRGDGSYVCTGALLDDKANSGTPYLLTARHCISTQEEAASIEAVWDERSETCGGDSGIRRKQTRTYGAQLLVSSAETDMALLRLDRVPPNRVFLGVELEPVPAGTPTYRLSHAGGLPQTYTTGVARDDGPGCASAPRPQFIYTSPSYGAVAMGSSGAPLLLPGLRVAGQLTGRCGPSPDDACAIYNDSVDGAIAASWPLLARYLDPAVGRRHAAWH